MAHKLHRIIYLIIVKKYAKQADIILVKEFLKLGELIEMKNIIAQKNNVKSVFFITVSLIFFVIFANISFAQNYEFSLVPRRAYDQIHIEIWAKSLNINAPKLGHASLVIQYNSDFLSPSTSQNLAQTDTVATVEANSTNPIITINSDFNNANGYSPLASAAYSEGFYSLEIIHNAEFGNAGIQPKTSGKGSFLGIISLDIIGNPQENDLANLVWSRTSPGNIAVADINGNDILNSINFVDAPADFTVVGVALLSPNRNQMVIDRDAIYKFLEKDYYDSGYPIYFERSINPQKYIPISTVSRNLDENLAYLLEYSLDNGTNWSEIGRIAETDKTAGNSKANIYKSGEIFEPRSSAYNITTQSGTPINATSFRKPLRVIWTKNPFFLYRSEQAKLRITMLNEDKTIPIANRTASAISSTNNGLLVLGRLFFVQLNGSSTYMKLASDFSNYSNATQLTVAAWVNLNGYSEIGSNPAIVASSGGPNTNLIFGSNEGSWMLYLRDGRVPAFRVRELLNRGDAATPNYLAICEAYPLDELTVVSATELSDAHAANWVHLAATVKDNTASLYVNGELVSQVVNTNAADIRMLVTTHPIWIGVNPNSNAITGNNNAGGGAFLNAGIKGVQVWRTALNQEQIRNFAGGISLPDSIVAIDDVKKGLELYYTLEGTNADLASNQQYQNGEQPIIFYNYNGSFDEVQPLVPITVENFQSQIKSENAINSEEFKILGNKILEKEKVNEKSLKINHKNNNKFQAEAAETVYRPDQPHIQVTAPSSGAGILNTVGNNTEIRWLTYGMADLNSLDGSRAAPKLNYEIEYRIVDAANSGDESWTIAKNPAGQNLTGNNVPQGNVGFAVWQPYQNNAVAANLRTISPYSKQVQLRLKGINSAGEVSFTSFSDTFTVAPHFALSMNTGSQLRVAPKMGMNITGDYAYMEAWIRPYRLPALAEVYFPLIEKSEAGLQNNNGLLHYSLRLNSDATLSFVIADVNNVNFTVRTSADFTLPLPNTLVSDSAWTHVGILFIKTNGNGVSEARFYIDGNVQSQEFSQVIQPNIQNEYPLFIGSNPTVANSFVGELKEIRFWNDLPNNYAIGGAEPTELTQFVQRAQAEPIKDMKNANKLNLHSFFSLESGSFAANGSNRVAAVSDLNGALLNNYGTPVRFMPFVPFIKLVEPKQLQSIANTDTNVKIRFVGLYYDGLDFSSGAKSIAPSLEYSLQGGGGNDVQPYQYVGSLFWAGNTVNSLKLSKTNDFFSTLSDSSKNYKYVAFSLNAAKANPDKNHDGIFSDQGELAPTKTNARLRLTGSYTINGEKFPLQSEGPLFTITPISNFTVRLMLEGYHQGNIAGKTVNQLGSVYDQGGLRIRLYKDNSGEVGAKVGSDASSTFGYAEQDPTNLNKLNNRFGNVEFVFTDVPDGSYWLLVEHINHLPIMSRYPVQFLFTGDVPTTWAIESGWDFMSWNGVDYNIMQTPSIDSIWTKKYYTARGTAVNSATTDPNGYSTTGLIFNGGNTGTTGLAGMVGGDVNQDSVINAADRVKVRRETGLLSYQSDITGDRFVNAVDRTITDKNFGKISSLYKTNIPNAINISNNSSNILDKIDNILDNDTKNNDKNSIKSDVFNAIDSNDVDLSKYFNKMAETVGFAAGNNPKDSTVNNLKNSETKKSNSNSFQANSYVVSAKAVYNDSGFVDLSMYIRNTGDEFAPANCTFAVSFDPEILQYDNLLGEDSVMFKSNFNYNNISDDTSKNNPENGYLKLSSAPQSKDTTYNYVRTIEIDYDAFANIGGINVPRFNTYLGTLRFTVKKKAGVLAFKWHNSKAIITTKGINITNDGKWDTIPAILLYNANLIQPNGGEKYSVLRNETVRWTTNGESDIFIEFSTNSGMNWTRLTTEPISSSLLSFGWKTPHINSNTCLMRIIDAATKIELTRSDSTFSIAPPWGYIDHPYSKPEPFKAGERTTIEWNAGGTDCVKFEFSDDGGATWSNISGTYKPESRSANWNVPRVTTRNGLVRMLDCESEMVITVSGKFMILNGNIKITNPRAKQILTANKTEKVRWTQQNVEFFDLELSTDSGRTWQRVASDVDAKESPLDWIVVDKSTDSALFRALYQGDPAMEYGRSQIFRIKSSPSSVFELDENSTVSNIFPNPANNLASVNFNFEKPLILDIKLLDIAGSVVKTLTVERLFDAGFQRFDFDISDVISGRYFLLIVSENFTSAREITISK